jgi:aspartyl-tRNA(Asn)/glutamyl-tRNA(Gln) amidotransferase subunit A
VPSPFAELTVDACMRVIREKNADYAALLHIVEAPRVHDDAPDDAPLRGVPYVLKDTWEVAGLPTTGGSWRHRARISTRSGRAHAALAKAGAVLLGKSSCGDLAFSPECANHIAGVTKNPHDKTRTSGGSTGGGAVAVALGMAAFDWGGDFGGSIRLPAAFCGVTGVRLSCEAWPTQGEHFPQMPAFFTSLLGWGPVARTVEGCREVIRAVRPHLRAHVQPPRMHKDEVVIYAPDRATLDQWPTFFGDAAFALNELDIAYEAERRVSGPSQVDELYNAYLCANFDHFRRTNELPLHEAIPAVLLGLASGGRLDRRLHPSTAVLLALTQLGVVRYRDAARVGREVDRLRAQVRGVWGEGRLIVAPVATVPAPKHGRATFDFDLQAFCKLGNLADATAVAIPFGTFAGGLPRSLQILGPPGAEDAVLGLAERIESVAHGLKAEPAVG